MVSNTVRYHNLVASMNTAYSKGDMKAVAKWARELAELAQPAQVPLPAALVAAALPASGNQGTNWEAAQIDAGFVFQASLGNLVGADTNPVPGAAKALKFSGVVGDSQTGLYGTFLDGALTATGANPGDGPNGFTTPFSLAAGIDKDAPYTGPGAVRP